jgi:hypothetical protein
MATPSGGVKRGLPVTTITLSESALLYTKRNEVPREVCPVLGFTDISRKKSPLFPQLRRN